MHSVGRARTSPKIGSSWPEPVSEAAESAASPEGTWLDCISTVSRRHPHRDERSPPFQPPFLVTYIRHLQVCHDTRFHFLYSACSPQNSLARRPPLNSVGAGV